MADSQLLTDRQVKNAKHGDKERTLRDGDGLFLLIKPNGSKIWRYRYKLDGRERACGLGSYPVVTLEKAREERDKKAALIGSGIDPVVHKSKSKSDAAKLVVTGAPRDFKSIALEWFARTESEWVESHAGRNRRRLERHIFPYLGDRDIRHITPPEMLKTLQRIEDGGAIETAHRVMQLCGKIFRYAVATGEADRDVTRDIHDQLRTSKVENHAAITDPKEIGPLLRAIDGYKGGEITRSALKLAPLVFVRPGELRHAKWADIDFDTAEWRFIASKTKQPHVVPLSRQALAILRDLKPLTSDGVFVFPNPRSTTRPMSENAVLAALRRMGFDDTMTGHGFRAMARTVLDEVLGQRVDWIEHQLAHAVKDPNGRAYNRTAHLPQRHAMMQTWADYLDNLRADVPKAA